ncbi:hypothetical protein B0H14DRAFT_2653386 [Mycena olivaceomarginata]|nr:hypothetical protein B0H14DRAFT_2653386 [Mycena olivaceomarginata]
MDVDTQNMEDNDDSGGKRRYEEHKAAKVHMVPGPQREEYDKAHDKQAFHRTRKSQAIAELQQHKGQMEAQFLGDQEKLQALYDQCNTIVPKLLESQKLLMQHNETSNGSTVFCSIQIQKTDENIQIPAYSYLQSKKTPQRTPPPRRGTCASLDPVRNSGTRTIEIPLDPILVTSSVYVNKISGLADTVDCDMAHVWAAQAKECRGRGRRRGREGRRMWRTKAWARPDQDDAREGDEPTKTTRGGYNRPTKTTSGWGRAPTIICAGDVQVTPRADNGDERVELRADKDAKMGGRMRGHNTKDVDKDDGQAGPRVDNGDERVEMRADKDTKTWGRMRAGHSTKPIGHTAGIKSINSRRTGLRRVRG